MIGDPRPTDQTSRTKRGAALLLALAALAIVVPAGAGALRGAMAQAVERSMAVDEERARLAAISLGPALLEWAARQDGAEAAPVVRPDGVVRALRRDSADGSVLVIDAIDLSGRLHVDALGTLARAGLPPPLDQLVAWDDTPHQPTDTALGVAGSDTPLSPESIAREVNHQTGSWAPAFPLADIEDRSRSPCVALWLTDFPRERGRDSTAPRSPRSKAVAVLNIRTAPIELLRAALVGYDPALARLVIEHRERGEPIPPEVAGALARASGAATPEGSGDRGWSRTPLTTRSDAYAFIVSVERGAGRACWWIVAERGVKRPRGGETSGGGGGGWVITERRRVHP